MHSDTFIQGIGRVLNCSKVQVAAAGLTSTWLAVHYAVANLPPTQRSALWVAFIGAVTVQLREIINAWSAEDVARVAGGTIAAPAPASSPPNPVNDVTSVVASVPATASSDSIEISTRSSDMPSRTKLPMILMGSALIAILGAAGCQTPTELATYREGLHQVDEPLYQAHLLLMNDAVTANIRTDADRQVVQQGIAAAESLYQQSKATEAAGVPTTNP